jgi:hypothetical protein
VLTLRLRLKNLFSALVGAWLSLARAPGSGPGGRWFKSTRPDHLFQLLTRPLFPPDCVHLGSQTGITAPLFHQIPKYTIFLEDKHSAVTKGMESPGVRPSLSSMDSNFLVHWQSVR